MDNGLHSSEDETRRDSYGLSPSIQDRQIEHEDINEMYSFDSPVLDIDEGFAIPGSAVENESDSILYRSCSKRRKRNVPTASDDFLDEDDGDSVLGNFSAFDCQAEHQPHPAEGLDPGSSPSQSGGLPEPIIEPRNVTGVSRSSSKGAQEEGVHTLHCMFPSLSAPELDKLSALLQFVANSPRPSERGQAGGGQEEGRASGCSWLDFFTSNAKGPLVVPRKRWLESEEAALQAGVAKYGHGKWKAIKRDPVFGSLLANRRNAHLKDKWRNMVVNKLDKTKEEHLVFSYKDLIADDALKFVNPSELNSVVDDEDGF